MSRIVLVGDSVFDNAAYVDGLDVRGQVEENAPAGWSVTLLAVDGSYIAGADMLGTRISSVGEALELFHGAVTRFGADYTAMLDALTRYDATTYVCTIYRPNFPDPTLQRVTSTALGMFNDVIVEEAVRRRINVLDIRAVFTEPRDYANPIEPSVEGGRKLAEAIVGLTSRREGTLIVT